MKSHQLKLKHLIMGVAMAAFFLQALVVFGAGIG